MPAEPHPPSHGVAAPWGGRDFEHGRFPLWAGRMQRRHEGSRGGSAAHSYAVVMLITRGESKMRHTGELVLRAGDVHLIPPGDSHRGGPTDVEGWALAFHPEVLGGVEGDGASRLGPLLRVRQGCHPVLRPTLTQRRRLARWIRLLAEESARNDRSREEASIALLRLVLIELERMTAPATVSEPPSVSLSRKALTYIEEHCLEPLSLAKVARELGRSSAHVAGLVRQETGRTVGEWILECRMAEARRRLRGTDERVDIIAERVGYADVTHFIRLFRRVHGVTPAAWRRKGTPSPS